jgi:uncharacterized RDD family membrane protein YckC
MNTEPTAIYCNHCGFKSAFDARFCQNCGQSFQPTPAAPTPIERTCPNVFSTAYTPAARYAGFWIRLVAALLDGIVVFVGFFPIRWLLGSAATLLGVSWQMPTARIFFLNRMIRIGFAMALAYGYRAAMESSHFQGTLGKLAVQIKVTDRNGNRISFERATGRYLAKLVSTITLGIGYAMIGFTPRKQGLHDQIAGTLVQYR